jgi:hypothetical protein
MERVMKESGKKDNFMDLESMNGLIKVYMLVSFRMEKNMDKESTLRKMRLFFRGFGNSEKEMEKEC